MCSTHTHTHTHSHTHTHTQTHKHTHTHTHIIPSVILLVFPLLRSSNACRRDAHQLGDVLIAYFIRRHVPACVPYFGCLTVAVHKPLLKPCKCALAVCLRPLCSQVSLLSLFAVGNPAYDQSDVRLYAIRYRMLRQVNNGSKAEVAACQCQKWKTR